MTGKTRIWVELTDEQMDEHLDGIFPAGTASTVLWHNILAQRPRPIAVGDRVRWTTSTGVYPVMGIHDGWAWLWYGVDKSRPYCSVPLMHLTRVDDEAKP